MASVRCFLSHISLLFLLRSVTLKSDEIFLRYRIPEEIDRGFIVGDVKKDLKLEFLTKPEFHIISHAAVPLAIGANSGVVVTDGHVDRDVLRHCRLQDICETAVDVAIKAAEYFRIVKVSVEIVDLNDNAPVFEEQTPVRISLRESATIGNSFPLPIASDADGSQNGIQRYGLESDTSSLALSFVSRRDGALEPRLMVKEALDREVKDSCWLLLTAYDGGIPSRNASIEVLVTVLDSNDHSPVFERPSYEVSVMENLAIGSSVMKIKATDEDSGQNSKVVYRFSEQTETLYGHLFGIDNSTGTITTRGEIDFETATIYHLTVLAFDLGPDSLPADAAVVIRVLDANDHPPEMVVSTVFGRLHAAVIEVPESISIGSFVGQLSVLDRDDGINGQVACNITRDPNSTTGSSPFSLLNRSLREFHIITAEQLDRETQSRYNLELTCWDGGQTPHISRKRLTIEVLDINDNRPTFTQPTYEVSLTENSPPNTTVLRVTARDVDLGRNGEFRYAVAPESAAESFTVSADGTIIAKRSFDREEFSAFRFLVTAVDGGTWPLTGTARVVVNIVDLNDEPAVFRQPRYSFSVGENQPDGTTVGVIWADDRDSPPNNHVRYAIVTPSSLPPAPAFGFFTIDAITGVLSTTRALDREMEPTHELVVVAYDRDRPDFSSTARVSVQVLDANDNHPVFVYPAEANETIEISSRVPVGHVLVRVSAFDVDSGENARLVYSLRDIGDEAGRVGGGDGAFAVDSESGDIYTTVGLLGIQLRLYDLVISALDMGRPAMCTEARLAVIVSNSLLVDGLPAEEARSRTPGTSAVPSRNLIMFALLMACSLVATLLLTALLVTLRQSKRKRKDDRSRLKALKDHQTICDRGATEPFDQYTVSAEHVRKSKIREVEDGKDAAGQVST